MKKFIKFFALALVCALSFVGLTACGKKTTTTAGLSDSLKNARDYLTSLYGKTNEDVTVTGDLTRLTSVSVTGGSVEVSWSVSVQESQVKVEAVEGESQVKIVIVDNKNSVGFSFVLTATLTLGEESTSLEWNCVVPAFKELTWAEYYAKKANDVVVVKGVVTALIGKTNSNSYNCIYFEDADGGYYAYGMEADPFTDANLKVGTTIRVSGLKDIYSGTHEIKEATYEILDSTV
ncbi:MAG: hypothetical protein K6G38_01295, partial [Gammaproteobacteria bacterium]|nr:hypothetical protein [Gammaproteobacteria bacterium]